MVSMSMPMHCLAICHLPTRRGRVIGRLPRDQSSRSGQTSARAEGESPRASRILRLVSSAGTPRFHAVDRERRDARSTGEPACSSWPPVAAFGRCWAARRRALEAVGAWRPVDFFDDRAPLDGRSAPSVAASSPDESADSSRPGEISESPGGMGKSGLMGAPWKGGKHGDCLPVRDASQRLWAFKRRLIEYL